MIADGVHIYLASSHNGALRVGLSLRDVGDCLEYFRVKLPGRHLIKDEGRNAALQKAVEAAWTNRPLPSKIHLDVEGTPFQRKVWEAITRIPYGVTKTYGEVARMVGKPMAARAVGQAMGRNPLPLIHP